MTSTKPKTIRRHRPAGIWMAGVFFFPLLLGLPPMLIAKSSEKAQPKQQFHVALDRVDDMFVHHPTPEYPIEARRVHVSGSGKFQINFDASGKVASIAVLQSTGYIILDHACLWAFVHWQLRHPGEYPAVRVPITFTCY